MSLTSLNVTMARIAVARPYSQIAVFRSDKPGLVDSKFAATVETQKQIQSKNKELIGVYDATMPAGLVKDEIRAALATEAA